MTAAALTGGVSLLFGASRSKDKITITFVRSDAWKANHPQPGAAQIAAAASNVVVMSAPVDYADQLKKLSELNKAGILSDEEFAAKKADILAKM